MQTTIHEILRKALAKLASKGMVPGEQMPEIPVERPKVEEFGDFGTPLPLVLAKQLRRSPKECATMLLDAMEHRSDLFDKIEFAPPGYINFTVKKEAWFGQLKHILDEPQTSGNSNVGGGERVLIEFVSANPTGPLHVGHARGAVIGDALARVMKAAGYDVSTEYYINDVGNQIATFGLSVWARAREALGLQKEADFPDNGYRGNYVKDIALSMLKQKDYEALFTKPYEELGKTDKNPITEYAKQAMLKQIKEDLDVLGVSFDLWFPESSLHERGLVTQLAEKLVRLGKAYKDERGALLFAMEGEEEKDRVIIRANQVPTYFASDIAYHVDKFSRGFSRLINIWGADHHGYIPRVKKALEVLGYDPRRLEILLVQMVSLTRGGQILPMGKRTGEFVTLRQLVDEVGKDAVRFTFLLRKSDAQMEFDLDLAKSQTLENPVFYVQYGHARVASIMRKASAIGATFTDHVDKACKHLVLPEEVKIAKELGMFPFVVSSSAFRREPHHIAFYLLDLAKLFHSYYTKYRHTEKVITKDLEKTEARLLLVECVRRVLARGLELLGVGAPEEMHIEEAEDE
jgi:arginyl-tRNA synthetase